MEDKKSLPSKSEWKDMSINQLLDLKIDLYNIYYGLRASGASFANQYLGFIGELDALVLRKQAEAERDANRD
jgi:hypothetical protein